MSIIMTAGKEKVNWSPKDEKDEGLKKTASTEEQEVEASDDDKLYEAAKSFLENKVEKEAEAECVAEEEVEVVNDDSVVDDVVEEVSETVEGDAVSKVEDAVDKVEEALEEVKDAVEECVDGDENAVEDISDDVAEVEIEVVDEEPVSDEGEIIVESEPVCESCGAVMAKNEEEEVKESSDEKAEEEEVVEASSGDEFVRYSKISPKNRSKLRKYWKGMLAYAPDFVDLMTKDYE